METILNKLREEHREIQTLLIRIERSHGQEHKQELFDELKQKLIPHMEGEEKTLYAHLRTDVHDENVAEMANDRDFEHQELKDLLRMLDGEKINSDEWLELFSELKENFQLHMDEEESVLFNEAKEDFSTEELESFAFEFEEAKQHQAGL